MNKYVLYNQDDIKEIIPGLEEIGAKHIKVTAPILMKENVEFWYNGFKFSARPDGRRGIRISALPMHGHRGWRPNQHVNKWEKISDSLNRLIEAIKRSYVDSVLKNLRAEYRKLELGDEFNELDDFNFFEIQNFSKFTSNLVLDGNKKDQKGS